jgi:hypothetical protein
MAGTPRAAALIFAALLLPACNLTYVPDQTLPAGGNSNTPFVLLLPLDGELQAVTNPQFAWNAYPGALGYQLEISTASDFSEPIFENSALTITSTFLTQVTLTNFTNYYWRVYALLPGGAKVLAGGSPFQFRTQGGGFTTPTAFATQYPSTGLTGVSISPLFTWQASIAADSYTLQLDTLGTFVTPLLVVPGIHVNRHTLATPLAPNTQYYWRVIAIGQLGNRYSDYPVAVFQTGP